MVDFIICRLFCNMKLFFRWGTHFLDGVQNILDGCKKNYMGCAPQWKIRVCIGRSKEQGTTFIGANGWHYWCQ